MTQMVKNLPAMWETGVQSLAVIKTIPKKKVVKLDCTELFV